MRIAPLSEPLDRLSLDQIKARAEAEREEALYARGNLIFDDSWDLPWGKKEPRALNSLEDSDTRGPKA